MTLAEKTELEVERSPLGARPIQGVCQLFLVRHGTTTLNLQNRYRGRRDVPLDARGYQDAVDAARLLSPCGVSAVYTGPLRRTIATAQIIADETLVPDLRILHGLNNVDYGVWEGLTAPEAELHDPSAFGAYRTSPEVAVCPAGERLMDAQARITQAVDLIGSRHAGEIVVGVTHAVMIRLLVLGLTGGSGESWRIPVGRGSLTGLVVQDGRISVNALPEGTDVD
jgi:broad specificity phosphatase PhoE